jgi:hypothetical protein
MYSQEHTAFLREETKPKKLCGDIYFFSSLLQTKPFFSVKTNPPPPKPLTCTAKNKLITQN